jgi:hypothetical protein
MKLLWVCCNAVIVAMQTTIYAVQRAGQIRLDGCRLSEVPQREDRSHLSIYVLVPRVFFWPIKLRRLTSTGIVRAGTVPIVTNRLVVDSFN